MNRHHSAIACGVVLSFCLPPARGDATFRSVGELPDGNSSEAYGVSGDGSTAVGMAWGAWGDPNPAFRWRAHDGMLGLGTLPGGAEASARAASADGSVVVGSSGTSTAFHAFRWTEGTGMVNIGATDAFGVSADGSVVVGYSSGAGAFRWTESAGMDHLGNLPGGTGGSGATGVSADGSVVVGWGTPGSRIEAFRWTEDTGMLDLGSLPGGDYNSGARGVSADGTAIVGWVDTDWGSEGFRWTEDRGMISLGWLWSYQGFHSSTALDTNEDGSIVVGYGMVDIANGYPVEAPFIWDEEHGMRNLQDVLEDDYGIDLSDWTLTRATGISDDGKTIVGYGNDFTNIGTFGWVVHLPEPSALLCVSIGALLFRGASQRR